ncbi:MAG: hypothetical protein MHMPM18_000159 [Marteilia pararefringens]
MRTALLCILCNALFFTMPSSITNMQMDKDYLVHEDNDLSNIAINNMLDDYLKMLLHYNHYKSDDINSSRYSSSEMRDILRSKPPNVSHDEAIEILSSLGNRETIFDSIAALCKVDLSIGLDELKVKNTNALPDIDIASKAKIKLGDVKYEKLMKYLFGPKISAKEYHENDEHQDNFEALRTILPTLLNNGIKSEEYKRKKSGRAMQKDFLSDRTRLYQNTMKSNARDHNANEFYPDNSCVKSLSEFYANRQNYTKLRKISSAKQTHSKYSQTPITLSEVQVKGNTTLISKYLAQIVLTCRTSSQFPELSTLTLQQFFSLNGMIFQQSGGDEKSTDLIGNFSNPDLSHHFSEAVDMSFICEFCEDKQRQIRPELVDTCSKIKSILLNSDYLDLINDWKNHLELLNVLKKDKDRYIDLDGLYEKSRIMKKEECTKEIGSIIEDAEDEFGYVLKIRSDKGTRRKLYLKKFPKDLGDDEKNLRKCFIHLAVNSYENSEKKMNIMMTELDAANYSNIHPEPTAEEKEESDEKIKVEPIRLDTNQQRSQLIFLINEMTKGIDNYDFHHNVLASIFGAFTKNGMEKYVKNTPNDSSENNDSLCDYYDIHTMHDFVESLFDFKLDELKELDVDEEFAKALKKYTIKPPGDVDPSIRKRLERVPNELLDLMLKSDTLSNSLRNELKNVTVSQAEVNLLHSKIFEATPASFFDTNDTYFMLGCAFGEDQESIECEGSVNTKEVAQTILKLDKALKKSDKLKKKVKKLSFVNIPLKTLPDFIVDWRVTEMTFNGVELDVDSLKKFITVSTLNLSNILPPAERLPSKSHKIKQRVCQDHYELFECFENPEALHRTLIVTNVDVTPDQGPYLDKIAHTEGSKRREGISIDARFFQKPTQLHFVIEMSALANLMVSNVYFDFISNDLLTRNCLKKLLILGIEEYQIISHLEQFCTEKIRVFMGFRQMLTNKSCLCTEAGENSREVDEEMDAYSKQLMLTLKNNVKTFIKIIAIFGAAMVLVISLTFERPQIFIDMPIYDKGSLFGNRVEYAALKLTNLQYKKFLESQGITAEEVAAFEESYQEQAYKESLKQQKIKSILKASNRYKPDESEKSDNDDIDRL